MGQQPTSYIILQLLLTCACKAFACLVVGKFYIIVSLKSSISFWASSVDETGYKLSHGGGVVLPLRSHTGKLRLKGVTFFRFQVYERVGILLVEVPLKG